MSHILRKHNYGYMQLFPIPSEEETRKFYEDEYYKEIKDGSGKPDQLNKFVSGGAEADAERKWLYNTLYADVLFALNGFAPGKTFLDVGCGTGELVKYLNKNGLSGRGIEPSADATRIACSNGIDVHNHSIESYISTNPQDVHAVIMLNVLEHVPNPLGMISMARSLLVPGGIFCVVVPNEFTPIQRAAQIALNRQDDWWVAIPDHINYFNFESLKTVLDSEGFDVEYLQADFPMEFFLLMGYNYLDNPELGKACHKKRVALEAALPQDERRKICQSFARAGIGRACFMVGRKT